MGAEIAKHCEAILPNFPSLQSDALLFDVLDRIDGSKDLVTGLVANVMSGPSELSRVDRELIATYVSALNGCNYCVTSHAALAKRFGADIATIEALREGRLAALPECHRPPFHLAAKVARDAETVTAADIAAITEQDWSEQAAFDCLFVSSLFCFINRIASHRIASAAGISVDDNQADVIAGMIEKRGYLPSR